MKRVNVILVILILVAAGCGKTNRSTDDFITVDVTASYPKTELMLQDFADVEYIPLQTTDSFVSQGIVMAIGKNYILVKNEIQDGDIFVFDRNGKAIRKINHLGQGPEDYTGIAGIVLDEDNDEIFVNNEFAKKIIVYDLNGNFKRYFQHREGYPYRTEIYSFDNQSLICYDSSFDPSDTSEKAPFIIISKLDGSTVNEIHIPYAKKIIPFVSFTIEYEGNDVPVGMGYRFFPIIPYQGDWILSEPSTDTLFRYQSDNKMVPFIIRTPSVQSMNPEVFLFPKILTNRYYFIETVVEEYNGSIKKAFPTVDLAYDTQEKALYEATVYNNDYTRKQVVDMKLQTIKDNEIIFSNKIEAGELVDDYEKGLLTGRLKEIAAKLDAEDNPVIMLVKQKK
ncbi:MAG: 6-bladed beta-propeller [Tannerella sp.]|jgi:hypothetical protein|nr:6-bladed beta-propeller [Tannerella sp.]